MCKSENFKFVRNGRNFRAFECSSRPVRVFETATPRTDCDSFDYETKGLDYGYKTTAFCCGKLKNR